MQKSRVSAAPSTGATLNRERTVATETTLPLVPSHGADIQSLDVPRPPASPKRATVGLQVLAKGPAKQCKRPQSSLSSNLRVRST